MTVDAVAQTLFPQLAFPSRDLAEKCFRENWGVTAELYKLNFYSAPSGKFKSHVDTPRGPAQFGSLVVCLPCPHKST